MSEVQLLHGDCLEIMPTLPEKSVQMVFADLPYGITSNPWDSVVDLNHLWNCFDSILTATAKSVFTATQPFATQLINSRRSSFKYDLIWSKERGTGHLCAKHRPMRSHEGIYVFAEKSGIYNPQKTYGHKPIRSCGNTNAKNVFYGSKLHSSQVGETSRHPLTVLKFSGDNDCRGSSKRKLTLYHPTQKPVALLEWLIRTYTNEGDTVLDPVFGSATTAIACMRTRRNFIGIEKDSNYFRIGSERVAEERRRLELM